MEYEVGRSHKWNNSTPSEGNSFSAQEYSLEIKGELKKRGITIGKL